MDYTTNMCFPTLLDAALAKRRDELTDVKFRGNLLFGPIQVVECDPLREHFTYNSWHCSSYERSLCDKGLCNFIPMIFRNLDFIGTAVTVFCKERSFPANCSQCITHNFLLFKAPWR